MPPYDIQIKKVPALRMASLWAKGLPFNVTVPRAYEELAAWMARSRSPFSWARRWALPSTTMIPAPSPLMR